MLKAIIGMFAMASIQGGITNISPSPSISGSFCIGGSRSFAPGNPYYSPRYHTVETYRSQQRAAKRRR